MNSLLDSKLAKFIESDGKRVAIYPALNNKTRIADEHHPEEAVRLDIYNESITLYGYPPELIEIEVPVYIREDETPKYADIVVYSDKNKKRPFIVSEVKQPDIDSGIKQGQRYATILRAVYVLWSNGNRKSASVIVNRYPEEAVNIPDIPKFLGQPN